MKKHTPTEFPFLVLTYLSVLPLFHAFIFYFSFLHIWCLSLVIHFTHKTHHAFSFSTCFSVLHCIPRFLSIFCFSFYFIVIFISIRQPFAWLYVHDMQKQNVVWKVTSILQALPILALPMASVPGLYEVPIAYTTSSPITFEVNSKSHPVTLCSIEFSFAHVAGSPFLGPFFLHQFLLLYLTISLLFCPSLISVFSHLSFQSYAISYYELGFPRSFIFHSLTSAFSSPFDLSVLDLHHKLALSRDQFHRYQLARPLFAPAFYCSYC